AALQREQRIAVRWIVELAVLHDIEARAQAIDRAQHLVGITALLALAREPFGFLGIAPRPAGNADGIRLHRDVRCATGHAGARILAAPGLPPAYNGCAGLTAIRERRQHRMRGYRSMSLSQVHAMPRGTDMGTAGTGSNGGRAGQRQSRLRPP